MKIPKGDRLMIRKSVLYMLLAVLTLGVIYPSYGQTSDSSTVEETMSLDVKDTDIRDVIRMISKGYGLNIILDRDVSGKVTLHLTDAPIIEGLTTLAESNGWELIKEGSVYRIRKPVAKTKSSIRFSRGKLTVDIQNMNVVDFIKELSSKTAASIVPDSKISGRVSGKLYQVPLEDGLKAILEGNGYKVAKRKNIYRVTQDGVSGTDGTSSRRSRRSSKGRSKEFYVECEDEFLNIDVKNSDLSDIINAIAEQSDIEIIIYGKLSGTVNAKLNNVPLTQGLALLLGGTKFTFVQKDNVILIGDRNTATPSGKTLSKSELVHLNHIKADEVPKILPKNIPAQNVKVIKEQNALLVSGTSEDIVKTREFLTTIDIPTPQVVIDVIVVEYTRDGNKDFGLEFAANKHADGGGMDVGSNMWSFPEIQINRSGSKAKDALSTIFGNAPFIANLPESFHLVLRLLEEQKKAKVLAQPSITVLNGNKATIDVGQTQYFKVVGGTPENPTHNFRPIKFGISLNITPWISRSGQITAEISPEISNSMGINENSTEGYPNLFRRSATTTVRIDDGKTLILGGLLRSEEQLAHRKVPILGDIPILGYLFKTTKKVRIQTNLVIYITPRIIDVDSYVDIEKELDQFNANERKGIFQRRNYDEVHKSAPDSKIKAIDKKRSNKKSKGYKKTSTKKREGVSKQKEKKKRQNPNSSMKKKSSSLRKHPSENSKKTNTIKKGNSTINRTPQQVKPKKEAKPNNEEETE